MAVTHGTDGEVDGARFAVLAHIGPLAGFWLALGGYPGEYGPTANLVAFLAAELSAAGLDFIGPVEQCRAVLTNHFRAAVAQQTLGPGVEQGDQTIGVTGDDRHSGRGVEYGLQKAPRLKGLFFVLQALQGGADPAGEQPQEFFIGLIEGARACLAGGIAQGAETPAGDPDAGADIAFQGKQRVAGVRSMVTLGHVRNGEYIVAA